MKKSLAIGIVLMILGVIISLIACALVGFDMTKFDTSIGFFSEEYKITNLNQDIVINSEIANIAIEKTTGEEIVVEIYSEKDDQIVVNENNKIEINVSDKKIWGIGYMFGYEEPTVRVYIPETYKGNVEVKSNIASIEVSNVELLNLNIESDIGEIILNNVNIDSELNIKSNIGSIEVENTASNTANFESNMGEIKFEALNSNNITIYSDIGKVEGVIKGNIMDYARVINTNIGTSNIDSSIDGDKKLEITTEMGEINIKFSE